MTCRFIYMQYVIYSACPKCVYTCTGVTVAKPKERDCGVNPCLWSSNRSRPHLSTYIVISEGQEGVVLLCESQWILPRAGEYDLCLVFSIVFISICSSKSYSLNVFTSICSRKSYLLNTFTSICSRKSYLLNAFTSICSTYILEFNVQFNMLWNIPAIHTSLQLSKFYPITMIVHYYIHLKCTHCSSLLCQSWTKQRCFWLNKWNGNIELS